MFLVFAAVMTVSGRNVRKNEICNNVKQAVYQTLEHNDQTEQELLAEIVENVLKKVQSSGKLRIDIAGASEEKGLLAVCVESQFQHPNGRTGTVLERRTAIVEHYTSQKEEKEYKITYWTGQEVYKEYILKENSLLPVPAIPGEMFLYWADEEGTRQELSGMKVQRDREFYAVMEEI